MLLLKTKKKKKEDRNVDDLVISPSISRKIVATTRIIFRFPTSKVTADKQNLSRTNPRKTMFFYECMTVYILSSFLEVVARSFKSRPQYSLDNSYNILISILGKQQQKTRKKEHAPLYG